jgi:hypothetical protein
VSTLVSGKTKSREEQQWPEPLPMLMPMPMPMLEIAGGAPGAKRRTNDLEMRRVAATLDRKERHSAAETDRH